MLPTTNNHVRHKKKNSIFGKGSGPFVIFFTVLMPTNCVILEQFYFEIKLDDVSQKIQSFLVYYIYAMAMWSYYQSITINNNTPERAPPPMDNRNIDMLYKNCASCEICNRWKPIRAHHCSMCGKCNLKMDHHCPWINNCVGLRNHRAFYLFTLYMTLGAIQYTWASWIYFKMLFQNTEGFFSVQSSFFYFFWSFTSVVLYPTCAMLCFLLCYHTLLIFQNQTTLEQMKSGNSGCCCFTMGNNNKIVNVFDRGWIANVAWFFNYSYFWFLPLENIYDTDGTTYPIAPLCTYEDVRQFDPKIDEGNAPDSPYDFNQIDVKFEEYLKQAKDKYKGKRIIFNGKEILIE